MRKKSQEELGTLVTREMKVMLQDESLTKEQRFDLLAAVMFDVPLIGFSIPIPYIVCYKEIQLSGVLK